MGRQILAPVVAAGSSRTEDLMKPGKSAMCMRIAPNKSEKWGAYGDLDAAMETRVLLRMCTAVTGSSKHRRSQLLSILKSKPIKELRDLSEFVDMWQNPLTWYDKSALRDSLIDHFLEGARRAERACDLERCHDGLGPGLRWRR